MRNKNKKYLVISLILIGVAILVFNSVTYVPAGYRGIEDKSIKQDTSDSMTIIDPDLSLMLKRKKR